MILKKKKKILFCSLLFISHLILGIFQHFNVMKQINWIVFQIFNITSNIFSWNNTEIFKFNFLHLMIVELLKILLRPSESIVNF